MTPVIGCCWVGANPKLETLNSTMISKLSTPPDILS